MIQKQDQIRKAGALFAFPASLAVWGWLSVEIFQKQVFRIPHGVVLLYLIFALWAIVRSYRKKDDGRLIWFAAMQSWVWGVADLFTGGLLGHFDGKWIPAWEGHATVVHLGSFLLPVAALAIMFPFAKSSYNRNKDKTSSAPRGSKATYLTLAGVMVVGAVREVLLAMKDSVIDVFLHGSMFLLSVFTFSFFSWFILFYHLGSEAAAKEEKEAVPLL